MITTALVNLWGQRVGAIAWSSDTGTGSFEYDRAFLESGLNLSPVKMPLASSVYSFPELIAVKTFRG